MDEEFDLEKTIADLEAEFSTEEVEEVEDNEVEETEEVEEIEETEPEVDEEVDNDEEKPQFENEKQENAFARMRKQNQELFEKNQELSKYEQTIVKIAEASGKPVEEVLEFYEEKILEEQAKEKGLTPEVLKLQQRLDSMENEKLEQKFNEKMYSAIDALELSEDDVLDFFEQCREANIDLLHVENIESIYKGLNFEKVLETELKKAEQQRLESKKKRMESTGLTHEGTVTDTGYDVDKDVEEALKRFNVF